MPGSTLDPLRVPSTFWQRLDVQAALSSRDFGQLLSLVHKYARRSQTQIGAAVGLAQGTVSQIMRGTRSVTALDVIERIADGLDMPADARLLLGLAPRPAEVSVADAAVPASGNPSAIRTSGPDNRRRTGSTVAELSADDERENLMRRRALLAGGLGAAALPTVNLDDLHRLVVALEDARRYLDADVVKYLRRKLTACATEDGDRGPRTTLPVVLGIIGVVDHNVRLVKRPVRRKLLALGARSAEFAGWLYRDIGAPDLADYWRDRAMEWAQAAGDAPMQGYILLKKSQSAWDQRNATRMLTLAEAAQEGPWRLPPRIQAEAAQQAARGYAMLTERWDVVARKLDEARSHLSRDAAPADPGVHYAAPLFELQTAICYHAAGQPHQALAIYDQQLAPETFSRRDYGYFLSLKSEALAAAGAPDDAADCGLQALAVAVATDSVRTKGELERLAAQLRPETSRPKVRELRQALLAV